MQSSRLTSGSLTRIRNWNQFIQFRDTSTVVIHVESSSTSSNTCRKDLHQLHFDDEPMVQEKQQVKDQHTIVNFTDPFL